MSPRAILRLLRATRSAGPVLSRTMAAEALGLSAADIADVLVTEVDQGTSQRHRVTVHAADGSRTLLFVKTSPARLGPALLDRATRLCEREVRFYDRVAPGLAAAEHLLVGALLTAWDDRSGRSVVVLPDLAARGVAFAPVAEALAPPQAYLALDALARLHAGSAKAPGTDDPIFDLDTPTARRTARLMAGWVGRGGGRLASLVPAGVLERSRILADRAAEYPGALASFPVSFVHNDTHRGNLGFTADRAVLIDWQVCGRGPALKDVAYLLATSLDPADRRRHESRLVAHYLDRVRAYGGTAPRDDDAWAAYRVLCVTGYVAAAVTARFGDRLQAAANSRAGLHRAGAAVADLDSFTALGERMDSLA